MTPPLRVLVADDELMARRRLTRLLGALPDVVIVAECARGDEVLAAVRAHAPDLLLLDIDMPGLSGVEALQLIPPREVPLVVFCTAHSEHAVTAFDAGAVDYLLKPVEADRLQRALDRARARRVQQIQASAPPAPAEPPAPLARLAVPTRQGIVLVAFADVSHASHDGALVTLHTHTAGALITDFTLHELLARLPADFVRVHRRAIVNLAHIARLEPLPTGGYVAHLRGGAGVEVSRAAARELRRRLGLARAGDHAGDD